MEPEDLLQEAFRRALAGDRKCPASLDVVRFFAETMRSIRDGELKRAKRRPILVAHQSPELPEPLDPAPNAEEQLAPDEEADCEAKREQVIGLFADDPAAQVIVEGEMQGMRGEDLRARTGLDPIAYTSKRRLISRQIERMKRAKANDQKFK
jgi:hypothetical protein